MLESPTSLQVVKYKLCKINKNGSGISTTTSCNDSYSIIKKEGKEYQVAIKIRKIKKGWFKDEVVDYTFEPLPNDKFILNKAKFWKTNPLGLFSEDYSPNTIKPTQRRKSGFILSAVMGVITLFIIVIMVKKLGKARVIRIKIKE